MIHALGIIPSHIVGISMGGMQTLRWIGQHPGFMQKAIAIDGSPRPTSYDLLQWQTHEQAVTMMQQADIENAEIMKFTSSGMRPAWRAGWRSLRRTWC